MAKNILYFRSLLAKTVQELEDNCSKWEFISSDVPMSEEVLGEIRTTVGLTKLLMDQKLKQFNGLIDDSEFKTSEKEITCLDLQGFWDMVNFEVEKIQKKFYALEKCKNNNWEIVLETNDQPVAKKKPAHPMRIKQAVSAKSLASAARMRLAEAKKKMMQLKQKENGFAVDTAQPLSQPDHTSSKNKSLKLSSSIDTEIYATVRKISEENLKESPAIVVKKHDNIKIELENKENEVSSHKQRTKSKSSERNEETESTPSFKSKKSKDFGKLQCVTRSAARTLTQKNTN